jgi:hypothetical protein
MSVDERDESPRAGPIDAIRFPEAVEERRLFDGDPVEIRRQDEREDQKKADTASDRNGDAHAMNQRARVGRVPQPSIGAGLDDVLTRLDANGRGEESAERADE